MSVVANVAINVDSRNAVSKLRQVQSQSKETERAVNGLGAAVGKLAAAFAAVQAVKFVFVQAAEVESQRRSLEVLTGSAQKAGQIIKELQRLGAVTPFTSTELIDSAKRLQAFGVEANKVVDTTRRLADVSGATGAELNGLVTAYGQVQAKGRLQGEELLQFQERGVALQKVLRDEYNLSGEEFQKALEKGQISAEAVEYAIQKLTDAGGKYANGAIAQSDTLNGKLSTLQDSFQRLAQNIGLFFEPVFKFLIDGINAFLERVNNAQRLGVEAQAYQEANVRTRNKFGGLRYANPFDQEVRQYQERVRKSLVQSGMGAGRGAAPSAPTAGAPPPLAAPRVGGGGRAAGGGSNKAADEAKRLAEQMKQQLKAADNLNFTLKNRLAIAQVTEPVAKRMLEYDIRQNEIAKEYDELKKAAKSADELALINANFIIENRIAQIESEQEINDLLAERATLMADVMREAGMPTVYNELETQDAALKSILEKYPAIGAAADAAATMATSGIAAMIAGTQSAEQVFAEFLSSIADALISTAKQMIAQYIAIGIARIFAGMGGGGGGFAPSGELAAVGNVGTGFNFDAGAMIGGTPWSFAGGGYTGNAPRTGGIDGQGGFPAILHPQETVIDHSGLRSAMGAAPGSGGGAPVLNMSFQSTSINGVEYVSRDQLEQAMAQTRRDASRDGARRGMTMTLDKLQQSPSTRSRVGMR